MGNFELIVAQPRFSGELPHKENYSSLGVKKYKYEWSLKDSKGFIVAISLSLKSRTLLQN